MFNRYSSTGRSTLKSSRSSNRKTDHGKGYGVSQESKDKKFRCREGKGYGHYQVECPNFLEKEQELFRYPIQR